MRQAGLGTWHDHVHVTGTLLRVVRLRENFQNGRDPGRGMPLEGRMDWPQLATGRGGSWTIKR